MLPQLVSFTYRYKDKSTLHRMRTMEGGAKRPLIYAALCLCVDAMASEAECADVIVGVSNAEATNRVKCEYDAGVVSGPYAVGHGGCALAKQIWFDLYTQRCTVQRHHPF